jgi:hypothetical protein
MFGLTYPSQSATVTVRHRKFRRNKSIFTRHSYPKISFTHVSSLRDMSWVFNIYPLSHSWRHGSRHPLYMTIREAYMDTELCAHMLRRIKMASFDCNYIPVHICVKWISNFLRAHGFRCNTVIVSLIGDTFLIAISLLKIHWLMLSLPIYCNRAICFSLRADRTYFLFPHKRHKHDFLS